MFRDRADAGEALGVEVAPVGRPPAVVATIPPGRIAVALLLARVLAEIHRRMALYGVPSLARPLPRATVVLVDERPATGLTMSSARLDARRRGRAVGWLRHHPGDPRGGGAP